MKYITVKEDIIVKMVIFSKTFTHADMAQRIGSEVVGAGFINWEDKECYGYSVSLRIPCHSKDTELLRWMHDPDEHDCPLYD